MPALTTWIDIEDVEEDVDTVQDSEPEREKYARNPRTVISAASTSNSVTVQDVDSDIEIILPAPCTLKPPQPAQSAIIPDAVSATQVLARRQAKRTERLNTAGGGFRTAAAILKDGEKRAQRDISTVSQTSASRAFVRKGKSPQRAIHILDVPRTQSSEDDSIYTLPPPISRITQAIQLEEPPVTQRQPARSQSLSDSDQDEPEVIFRNQLNKFRAKEDADVTVSSRKLISAQPIVQRSLFAAQPKSKSAGSALRRSSSTSASESSAKSTIPTQIEIPTPYLALITTCPCCEEPWTVTKTAATKLSHIRKCATSRGFLQQTIMTLVERQVRALHEAVDGEQRRIHADRTMFEATVSRKGKDVTVVGVEQKTRPAGQSTSDEENRRPRADSEASISASADETAETFTLSKRKTVSAPVLFTQNGSALSQATRSQVQREVDGKIKVAQRIARGDFIQAVLQPKHAAAGNKIVLEQQANKAKASTDSPVSALRNVAASNGIGSKNWKKAEELLAKSAAAARNGIAEPKAVKTFGVPESPLSDDGLQSSSDRIPRRKTGRLENYATSRYRLAERAKQVCAMRAVAPLAAAASVISAGGGRSSSYLQFAQRSRAQSASDKSDSDSLDEATAHPHEASFVRPYQRTDRLSRSYIDAAAYAARQLDYNAVALAGSVADTVVHRFVVSCDRLGLNIWAS